MNEERADADLPSGWALVSVHDAGAVQLGRQRSPDRRTGRNSTKYLRAANIVEAGLDLEDVLEMDFTPSERERYRLRSGDVVLAEASGSASKVGRSALWSGEIDECCYQNTVIRFRPHATEPEYALLVFRHLADSGVFADAARGLGIQHLGARRFSGLGFPLPPAEEQVRIVGEARDRLGQLDDAKESLRSALAKVGEQDREIYAAAALGALVKREPGKAGDAVGSGTPGRTSESDGPGAAEAGVSSAAKEETVVFGVLPNEWSWSTVGALGSVQLGIARSPKRGAGHQPTRYLRSANIREDGLDSNDVLVMDILPSERDRFDLRPGDVLVVEASGSSHQVGRSAIWQGELDDCSFQNHILRFRPAGVDSEYVNLVFKHYRHSGMFAERARGVGIQHLGMNRFSSMPVPLPPRGEQRQIVEEANERLANSRSQAVAIRQSLSRSALMESEILRAAVTGTLVPQREGVESALELLRRVGPPPEDRLTGKRSRRTSKSQKGATRMDSSTDALLELPGVLRRAGRQVGLEELFALAGYDRNSPEEVEAFYLELRRELGETLQVVGDAGEGGTVELI